MRPYIAGLCVNTKHGLEAFPVGVHRRPVTFHQKVIVSKPLGQVIVVHHHPPSCPYSPGEFLRLLKSSWWHRQEVQSTGVGAAWTLPRCRWFGFILQSYILPVLTSTAL